VPLGSPEPRWLEVAWINDPAVGELLAEARPELVVIMGVGILRAELLAAIAALGSPTLNVHGGYLPDYRGNHSFFWALYHGDFDRIGSTIHLVNEGIDAGDIVEIVVPEMRLEDDAEELYCRAERLALHRLVELLEEFGAGLALPRHPPGSAGRLFRMRDRWPHHDLVLGLRRLAARSGLAWLRADWTAWERRWRAFRSTR
jgi:methionyl-tRNA formyltransferase